MEKSVWIPLARQKAADCLTPETCLKFLENEDNCDACDYWNTCWGESPWEAARAEYDRSR